MLLMPNKKKVASIIVASLGHRRASEEPHVQKLGEDSGTGEYKIPEPEDESAMGLESAMEEFLRAADKKDARGMARAFRNALVLCDDDGHESAGEVE